MIIRTILARLISSDRGSMTIEMAAVAPVLVLMSIGVFEVSSMVSRQQELQSAAGEGETIALAAAASDETTSIDTIEDIIRTSMDPTSTDNDLQVRLSPYYRCAANETLVTAPNATSACPGGEVVTSYLKLKLSDRYEPIWTQFGIGSAFYYDVERMVQL